MRRLESVTIDECREYLRSQRTGVQLNPDMDPRPEECDTFRATLEDVDLDRIFLWWEYRHEISGDSTKLTNVDLSLLKPSTQTHLGPLINGIPEEGKGPIDLRTAIGMEPFLLTNDPARGPLYAIDGNHRLIAQFLMKKPFEGASIYVCSHQKMLRNCNITSEMKNFYATAIKLEGK